MTSPWSACRRYAYFSSFSTLILTDRSIPQSRLRPPAALSQISITRLRLLSCIGMSIFAARQTTGSRSPMLSRFRRKNLSFGSVGIPRLPFKTSRLVLPNQPLVSYPKKMRETWSPTQQCFLWRRSNLAWQRIVLPRHFFRENEPIRLRGMPLHPAKSRNAPPRFKPHHITLRGPIQVH